jgi:hypothetical protein
MYMAPAKQVKANRENAQKSTGPQSEAGLQASSRNAFRHGLTGHGFALLDWERAETFDRIKADFELEHQPTTPTESVLVERMVQHYWLVQRCISMQTALMVNIVDDSTLKAVDTYIRYQTHHQRQFDKALAMLLTLRAETRKAEIGSVSQKQNEAQETRKMEVHAVTIEIKKKRLEREKSYATIAGIKAGKELAHLLPPDYEPDWEKIAAA